jgi:O-methyltransferase
MDPADFEVLVTDTRKLLGGQERDVGVLGLTEVALDLVTRLQGCGLGSCVSAIYAIDNTTRTAFSGVPVRPISKLAERQHELLIVAADAEKEEILWAAKPFVVGVPDVVIAGYGHHAFRDNLLRDVATSALVPSLANGYPHTLTHLYQCLVNCHRQGLEGTVAEFGMFKGGTTMMLSRIIEALGASWPVIGFDTFAGFPKKKSFLDMYAHPDCVFRDVASVRRYLQGRQVEIVEGDIEKTCRRLDNEDLVLTFVDTDNYSSAMAAIATVRERTLVGGAIVFDHFTGVDRFRYTLGEKMAARLLLEDPRYFCLHGTGVFYRQADRK